MEVLARSRAKPSQPWAIFYRRGAVPVDPTLDDLLSDVLGYGYMTSGADSSPMYMGSDPDIYGQNVCNIMVGQYSYLGQNLVVPDRCTVADFGTYEASDGGVQHALLAATAHLARPYVLSRPVFNDPVDALTVLNTISMWPRTWEFDSPVALSKIKFIQGFANDSANSTVRTVSVYDTAWTVIGTLPLQNDPEIDINMTVTKVKVDVVSNGTLDQNFSVFFFGEYADANPRNVGTIGHALMCPTQYLYHGVTARDYLRPAMIAPFNVTAGTPADTTTLRLSKLSVSSGNLVRASTFALTRQNLRMAT